MESNMATILMEYCRRQYDTFYLGFFIPDYYVKNSFFIGFY